MYAIFRAQGKQFRAVQDARLRIPTLEAAPGDKVSFEVLLAARDGDVRVGTPALDGARVDAEVLEHGRGDKIIVYKMKRRKGYRRKQGHRQGYTDIRITDIAFPKGKKAPIEGPAEKPAVAKPAVAKPAATAPVAAEPAVEVAPVVETVVEAPPVEVAEPSTRDSASDDIDITPAARELAEAHGLDLASVEGTGKDGRILKSDIDRAIKDKEGA
jgi:large subunit ribosomal protein L21